MDKIQENVCSCVECVKVLHTKENLTVDFQCFKVGVSSAVSLQLVITNLELFGYFTPGSVYDLRLEQVD